MSLCADDYGMSPEINAAILSLAESGKLDRVSVLVSGLGAQDSARLKKYSGPLKIGLHLDLLNLKMLLNGPEAEIRRQRELFRNHFGFFPAYYDGHMHAHLYPFIRNALVRILNPGEEVRSLSLPPALRRRGSFSDRLYMNWLRFNNFFLQRLLARKKLATNGPLYGSFNAHAGIAEVYRLFQGEPHPGRLFFFHPGLKNTDESLKRKDEYDFIRQA